MELDNALYDPLGALSTGVLPLAPSLPPLPRHPHASARCCSNTGPNAFAIQVTAGPNDLGDSVRAPTSLTLTSLTVTGTTK